MGKNPRRKQQRLAEKLLQVRLALGLSQNEMLRKLGAEESLQRGIISNYEMGEREPPLYILLGYARLAGVCLERLVDDDLNLPDELPRRPKHKAWPTFVTTLPTFQTNATYITEPAPIIYGGAPDN